MPPKLSAQKTEKLIQTVRENEGLYDPTKRDYADFNVKVKLWSIVAGKCGMRTGHEAKMMWKNLRDCYRIYRNKMHCNPNQKKWKYYEEMDFLAPYIKDRKYRSMQAINQSVSSASSVTEVQAVESCESIEIENSIQINENEGEFTTIQYWNEAGEAKFTTTKVEAAAKNDEAILSTNSPEVEDRPESPIDSENESYEDILPDSLNNGSVENNSLKMFFDAMYASTSQLPANFQRSVKNKIFAAVLEAEEEAEMTRSSPSRSIRIKDET